MNVVIWSLSVLFYALAGTIVSYAQTNEPASPILVNGDVVEYSNDNKEVTASGNVYVVYKNAKLSCQKLTVNTQTKDAVAEGNVKLEDAKGIILGDKVTYNFDTKKGNILGANFQANPFYGKAERMQKVSESEYIAYNGYATTCDFDHPHFRLFSKKFDYQPQKSIEANSIGFYLGEKQVLYVPKLKLDMYDLNMPFTIMPGYSKKWGPALISSYRYKLNEYVKGRIYFDYRNKLGLGEGFDTFYNSPWFGKGNFKYYYTHEHDDKLPLTGPTEFQRYFIRWRHKWDIDPTTNLVAEYYKIVDSKRVLLGTDHNILKDYFPREYDKDAQPPTYALFHHSFDHSSIDFLYQKRINNWYDHDKQLEKLPEIKFSVPSIKIGQSPFYYENVTTFDNLSQLHTAPSTGDFNITRLDTFNKVSLPMKVSFVRLTPFIGSRQTYYDKELDGQSPPVRDIFYAGADASTKFYKIYDVKTNFLGMDVNGLRHIITPSIGYTYNTKPSIASNRLFQVDPIDPIDSIAVNNSATLELSNKLQTKRNGATVDLLDLRLTTNYSFYATDPQTQDKSHGSLKDLLIRMKVLPYSWMQLDLDSRYETEQHRFDEIDPGLTFTFDKDRYVTFAHRYLYKGGKEFTFYSKWRLNPKWRFSIYDRYQFAHIEGQNHGLAEQEYTLTRDLHCWEMDITYRLEKNNGSTILLAFRLKAFPELGFHINQSYNPSHAGSQNNP